MSLMLRRSVVYSVLCFLLSLIAPYTAIAETPTLKGSVEKTAERTTNGFEGQVVDAQSQQPVTDALVTLPDKGFKMKTNAQGRYQIPPFLGKHPLIMSVQKPGYAPFSITVSESAPPLFQIQLRQQAQFLVLDETLRHLGDGSYSPYSTNASNFMKPPDGPAIRIPFSTNGFVFKKDPTLVIGSIIGIDTPMVHFLSQSPVEASATPLLIKLNGNLVAQVQVNGDNQHIQLPKKYFNPNGSNLLELEAGYQYPDPTRIDYDDMELIHLTLMP